jgi:hypothetical protein
VAASSRLEHVEGGWCEISPAVGRETSIGNPSVRGIHPRLKSPHPQLLLRCEREGRRSGSRLQDSGALTRILRQRPGPKSPSPAHRLICGGIEEASWARRDGPHPRPLSRCAGEGRRIGRSWPEPGVRSPDLTHWFGGGSPSPAHRERSCGEGYTAQSGWVMTSHPVRGRPRSAGPALIAESSERTPW